LPRNLRLTRLSSQREITIFLIREELKIQKVISSLHDAGFDVAVGFGLDTLILSFAGFEEHTDELYNWYITLLDKHNSDFDIRDNESLNESV
jgi:hypothetical protein